MYLLWCLCISSTCSSGSKINRNLDRAKIYFKFLQIWKSYLEWVTSYHMDKLKMGQILTFKLNLTLKVKANTSIKQYGWVIPQTSSWLPHTQTNGHRDRQMQATTIPGRQNWPRVKMTRNFTDVRGHSSWWHMKHAQHAAHNPKFENMGLFRHPRWWP